MKPLNPSEFVIVPHVCALDEFVMRDESGGFVATINESYIDKFVAHMNAREATTGDLSPLVIGHTQTGLPEQEQPAVVGYARNWVKGPWTQTDGSQVTAAFFDAWVNRADVEEVRKYPRRSCEIWASRYEADPISLLGATTPCRDLGLMRLARNGSLTYYSPGEMQMPDTLKPEDKESGANKGLEAKLDQVLAAITQLTQSMATGTGAAAKPGAGPADGAGGGADAPMSDEELEQLLSQMGGGSGGAPEDERGKKPEDKPQKEGNGANDPEMCAKMSRLEQELATQRSQVSTMQVQKSLSDMQGEGLDVNPDDSALISDLIAMPPDMRLRALDRHKKMARPRVGGDSFHLNRALDLARPGVAGGGKRISSGEEMSRIVKLARDKKIDFTEAARLEGYTSVN